MIYWLTQKILSIFATHQLGEWLSFLVEFRYITIRSAFAGLTAFLISFFIGRKAIPYLRRHVFQPYSDESETRRPTHEAHAKIGTPTMGGLIIIIGVYVSTLMWAQLNQHVVTVLLVLFALTVLGLIDDMHKLKWASRSKGLSPAQKLLFQLFLFSSIVLILAFRIDNINEIVVPFFSQPSVRLSLWLMVPFYIILMIAFSNGMNICDGMDGLAIGLSIILTGVLIILTYIAGHFYLATYIGVPFVRGAGELTVFCSALAGASLAFYWFNTHPAEIFMGDTGSLTLGGIHATVAVLVHQPLILIIAGIVILTDLASSIMQIWYFKITKWYFGNGKRIFPIAPIHFMFKLSEEKIVTRFHIVGILWALIAIALLRIR